MALYLGNVDRARCSLPFCMWLGTLWYGLGTAVWYLPVASGALLVLYAAVLAKLDEEEWQDVPLTDGDGNSSLIVTSQGHYAVRLAVRIAVGSTIDDMVAKTVIEITESLKKLINFKMQIFIPGKFRRPSASTHQELVDAANSVKGSWLCTEYWQDEDQKVPLSREQFDELVSKSYSDRCIKFTQDESIRKAVLGMDSDYFNLVTLRGVKSLTNLDKVRQYVFTPPSPLFDCWFEQWEGYKGKTQILSENLALMYPTLDKITNHFKSPISLDEEKQYRKQYKIPNIFPISPLVFLLTGTKEQSRQEEVTGIPLLDDYNLLGDRYLDWIIALHGLETAEKFDETIKASEQDFIKILDPLTLSRLRPP